jgi:hypothetical protein
VLGASASIVVEASSAAATAGAAVGAIDPAKPTSADMIAPTLTTRTTRLRLTVFTSVEKPGYVNGSDTSGRCEPGQAHGAVSVSTR